MSSLVQVVLWGGVLMCHAACNNFASLAACRTFLGVLEASVNPATMLIFGMWYRRIEQPLRMGMWIGSAGLAYVIGGVLNYGIGHAHTALDNWRLIFLVSMAQKHMCSTTVSFG